MYRDQAVPKGGKNALAFVLFTAFLNMLCFSIIIPVKPQLLMTVLDSDLTVAAEWSSLLLFGFAVAQFFFVPIWTSLADRFGRRPIILIALLATTIDFIIMGFAQHIGVLFAARIFSGVFVATVAVLNTYVADVSPHHKKAANFGLIGAAIGAGMMLGPSIGGLVGDEFGIRAPFFLAAILAGLNFIWGAVVLPETLSKNESRPFYLGQANPIGLLFRLKQYTGSLAFFVVVFLLQLAFFVFPATWSFYALEKFGWSLSQIGGSLFIVGLTNVLVQGFGTKIIVAKIGELSAITLGMVITLLSFIAYAFASEAWMVIATILVGSLGGVILPSLQGLMSKRLPMNAQGMLHGSLSILMSIAMVIAPPAMMQLFSIYSSSTSSVYFPGAAFVLAGVLVALAFIPLAIGVRQPTSNTLRSGDSYSMTENV